MSSSRWQRERSAADSREYIARFAELATSGADLHGEARAVDALLERGSDVLDAGCGTGRLGSELARRGHRVTAVDLDPVLVDEARRDPALTVYRSDLVTFDAGSGAFDAVVAAGNVMVFLEPGTESAVIARSFRHLRPGGLFVVGFALDREYRSETFVAEAIDAGFAEVQSFSTWTFHPCSRESDWVVHIARKA